MDTAEARSLLATANRILVHEEILDGYGHVSVRDPENERHYLMARYLPPSLVSAEDVRAFDFTGQLVVPEDCALYSERFIHAAVYRARPDVHAVCHTHAAELVAFGVAGVAPRPVFHMAASFGTHIPIFDDYHPDSGLLINDLDQADRLAAVLGERKAALMRGHGAVVTGDSLPEVVMGSVYFTRNARIRLAAATLGGQLGGQLGGHVTELTERECAAGKALIGRPASVRRAWRHLCAMVDQGGGWG